MWKKFTAYVFWRSNKMKAVMPTIAATTAAMASGLAYATPPESPARSVFPRIHEEVSQMIVRPKNQMELVKNLKYIFDHDLELQDEFYTEISLKDAFNFDKVIIDSANNANGDRRISAMANELSSIFPQPDTSGGADFMPKAFLGAVKASSAAGTITASVNFRIDSGGPSFQEAWKIFGEKFIKLIPELPPLHGGGLPARVPHGDEKWRREWVDDKSEKMLTLAFNRDAELSAIIFDAKKQEKRGGK
jgi:hypothetical protein